MPLRIGRKSSGRWDKAMQSLDEYIMQAAKDGAVRSGIILGIRMSLTGLRKLGIEEIVRKRRSLVLRFANSLTYAGRSASL